MNLEKPYKRIYRPNRKTENLYYHDAPYINNPIYAKSPERYVQSFLVLLKDFQELCEYVSIAEDNLLCYSIRIHSLLVRACIEIEANFKAILKENNYFPKTKKGKLKELKMGDDYIKVNKTHLLSKYSVKIPTVNLEFSPFKKWDNNEELEWYKAYNQVKHDRHTEFKQANLKNLVNAICGLFILLSSQFGKHNFFSQKSVQEFDLGPNQDGFEPGGIGEFFYIKFPNFSDSEKYNFDWYKIKSEENLFRDFNYHT